MFSERFVKNTQKAAACAGKKPGQVYGGGGAWNGTWGGKHGLKCVNKLWIYRHSNRHPLLTQPKRAEVNSSHWRRAGTDCGLYLPQVPSAACCYYGADARSSCAHSSSGAVMLDALKAGKHQHKPARCHSNPTGADWGLEARFWFTLGL